MQLCIVCWVGKKSLLSPVPTGDLKVGHDLEWHGAIYCIYVYISESITVLYIFMVGEELKSYISLVSSDKEP